MGLTVYGPRDYLHREDWSHRVFDYYVNTELVPALPACPAAGAYFELSLNPPTDGYIVDIRAPNIYVWGYLAARR